MKLNKIIKLKNPIKASINFLLGSIIISLTGFIIGVSGAPPTSPYYAGETLSPSCSPGDANCTVYSPLTTTITATTTVTLADYALNFDSGTLYIDSLNNRIGIGTTTPPETLTVSGPVYLEQITAPADTYNKLYNTTGDLYWNGNLIGGGSVGNWTLSGSDVYRISGNVGIGTSSPAYKLDVGGDMRVGIAGANSDAFYVDTGNGRVGIGTSSPATFLSVAGSGYFTGGMGVGMLNTTSGTLNVSGQCVTADTKLRRRRKKKKHEKADPEKGEWEDDEYIYDEVMIKNIRPGDEIASMHPITGELVYSQVNGLLDMGIKKIYRLTTLTGRSIRTTANHPYFTRGRYDDKDVLQNTEPQHQKLYKFEVDQSIKIEQFSKDSVVAIANEENSITLRVPKEVKQELRMLGQKYNKPRLLRMISFASAVVSAINQAKFSIHELMIDTEYIGYENIIADIIKAEFPDLYINFKQIGKQSFAHLACYGVHKKQKIADYTATIDDLGYNTENALRTGAHSHISRTIHSPRTFLINSISNDKKFVKRFHTKDGMWTKVKDLEKGRMIAVTYGDKVVWEKITKIEQLPEEKVYDIEVEGTRNFIGNNIVAHNTYLGGNVGIGTTSPLTKLSVQGTAGEPVMNIASSTGASLLYVSESGNVGIGTESPSGLLHLNQTPADYSDNPTLAFGDGDTGIYERTDDNVRYTFSGTDRWKMSSTAFASISTDGVRLLRTGVSATVPSIMPRENDEDTGIGSAGADILSLIAGGTNVMNVTSSSVGIGTTSPFAKLAVTNADAGHSFLVEDSTSPDSTPFVIDADGKVGIGTGEPSVYDYKLDVNGNILADGLFFADQTPKRGIDEPDFNLRFTSYDDMIFRVFGATYEEKMRITSGGSIGIGTTSPFAKLAVTNADAGHSFLVEDSTSPDSTPFVIDADGNVGIGTSSPDYPLSIVSDSGDVSIISDGTNNATFKFTADGGVRLDTDSHATLYGLGIGKDPTYALDVSGTIRASSYRTLTISQYSTSLNGNIALGNNGIAITRNQADVYPSLIVQQVNASSTGDILQLKNDASTVLVVQQDGNIGIGTTSPFAKLAVTNADAGHSFLVEDSTSPDSTPFVIDADGRVGIGTDSPDEILHIVKNYNDNTRFIVDNQNAGSAATAQFGLLNGNSIANSLRVIVTGTGYSASGAFAQNAGIISAGTYLAGGLSIMARETNANIRFYTGGYASVHERMRITSTGKVGIGTTSPLTKLSVQGTAGEPVMNIASSTGASLLYVSESGNVGIGTVSPSYKLDVDSTNLQAARFYRDSVAGSVINISNNQESWNIGLDGSENLVLYITNIATPEFSINDGNGDVTILNELIVSGTGNTTIAGNLGIGTTSPFAKLAITNADAGHSFLVEDSTSPDSTPFVIDADGNVGIGTDSPSYELDVAGSIGVDDNIYHNGDTNTYMTFGADQVYFTVGDHSQMLNMVEGTTSQVVFNSQQEDVNFLVRWDSGTALSVEGNTGNIGIGTTSPFAKLAVTNADAGHSFLVEDSTSPDSTPFVIDADGNVGIGTGAPSEELEVAGEAIFTGALIKLSASSQIQDSGNTDSVIDIDGAFWQTQTGRDIYFSPAKAEAMRITTSGNIGIGTTSPLTKLSVQGTAGEPVMNIASSTGASLLYVSESGNVGIGTGEPGGALHVKGSSVHKPTDTGIYFGGVVGYPERIVMEMAGNNDLMFDFTTGDEDDFKGRIYYKHATNYMSFYTDTTEQVRIDSSGSVGIGTTSPFAKLAITNADAGHSFLVEDSTSPDSTPFVIDADGNVGIGTVSPGAALEVSSSVANSYAPMLLIDKTTTGTNDAARMQITAENSNFIINAYGSDSPGVLANSVGFFADGNTADFIIGHTGTAAGEDLHFFTNNQYDSAQMILGQDGDVTFTGNIGIGTTSPLTKLSVQGTAGEPVMNIASSTGESLLYVSESGNVGIGTESPGYKLDVNGNSRIDGTLLIGTTAGTANLDLHDANGKVWRLVSGTPANNYFSISDVTGVDVARLVIDPDGNIGIGTTSPFAKLAVTNADAGHSFLVEDSTSPDSTPFVIDADGNVGIGTDSPQRKVHIVDADYPGAAESSANTKLIIEDSDYAYMDFSAPTISGLYFSDSTSGRGAILYYHSNDHLQFRTAGAEKMRITTTGNVGIGTTTPDASLSIDTSDDADKVGLIVNVAASPSVNVQEWKYDGVTKNYIDRYGNWYYSKGTTAYLGTADNAALNFTTGGTGLSYARMTIQYDGDVGIGTTTPAYKLDVYGNSRIEGTLKVGAYTLPSADGNSGYVLKTNAAGTVSWQQDLTNGAGGGTASGWATTTDDLLIYTVNNASANPYYVVIGGSATTSADYQLEVIGNSLFDGANFADSVDIGAAGSSARLTVKTTGTTDILNLFETGGVEVFTVLESGNVGIGTTSPFAKLAVTNADAGHSFLVEDSTSPDSTPFVIDADGNVGIGTAAPGAKLHLFSQNVASFEMESFTDNINFIMDVGTDDVNNEAAQFILRQGGSNRWAFGMDSGEDFMLTDSVRSGIALEVISNGNMFLMQDGGNVGIGTTSPLTKLSVQGTAGEPVMNIASSTGASLLYVSESGNVGIGTDSPGSSLHVKDTITIGKTEEFDGKIEFPESGSMIRFDSNVNQPDAYLEFRGGNLNNVLLLQRDGDVGIGTVDGITNSMWIHDGNIGIGTTSPFAKLAVTNADAGHSFLVEDSTSPDSTPFVIDADGNVGIGTAAPVGNLLIKTELDAADDAGMDQFALNIVRQENVVNVDVGIGFRISSVIDSTISPGGAITFERTDTQSRGSLHFKTKETAVAYDLNTRMSITSTGNVGIGTTSPFAKLAVTNADAGHSFLVEDSTSPDSTPFVIDADGKVGIGTGAPGAVLDVGGNFASAAASLVSPVAFFSADINGRSGIDMRNINAGTVADFRFVISDTSDDYIAVSFAGDNNNNLLMGGHLRNTLGALFVVDRDLLLGTALSNDVYIDTNSVERFRITSSGNIGIGTTSPLTKLSVQGTAGEPVMNIASSTGASLLYVSESGNVGIGTDSPDYALDVAGDINIGLNHIYGDANTKMSFAGDWIVFTAGAVRMLDFREHATQDYILFNQDNIDVDFQVDTAAGDGALFIKGSTGNIGIGTTSPLTKLSVQGTAGEPVMNIASSTGASLLYVSESGNVGIGTDSPSSKLHIVEDPTGKSISNAAGLTFQSSVADSEGYVGMVFKHQNGTALSTFTVDDDGPYDALFRNNQEGLMEIASVGNVMVSIDDDGDNTNRYFSVQHNNGTELFRVQENGNLGIGTTSPFAKLAITNADAGHSFLVEDSTSPDSTPFVIDADGNVGIGTVAPSKSLHLFSSTGGNQFIIERSSDSDSALSFKNTEDQWVVGIDQSNSNAFTIADNIGFGTTALNLFTVQTDGNVGIGTTTPAYKLDVYGGDLWVDNPTGTSTITGNLYVMGTLRATNSYVGDLIFANDFRITESAGLENETLLFNNPSNQTIFALDAAGRIGIGTTTPSHIFTIEQGTGNAIADGWDVYSSEEYKTDINYLEEQDYEEILDEIGEMDLARYKWKDSAIHEIASPAARNDRLMLGVITEYAPEQVVSEDGKSISLYDYASFAMAGVKGLMQEFDDLKNNLTVSESEDGTIINTNSILTNEQLAVLDKFVIGDAGELTTEDIKAKKITTGQLVINQSEDEEVQVAGIMATSTAIGADIIATGTKQIIIETTAVRLNSKIFITPTVLTDKILTITEKINCQSFKVEIMEDTQDAINFDWWIVQTGDVSDDDCDISLTPNPSPTTAVAGEGSYEKEDGTEETGDSGEAECGLENLDLCDMLELCEGIGLYFYDDVCNLDESEETADSSEDTAGDSEEQGEGGEVESGEEGGDAGDDEPSYAEVSEGEAETLSCVPDWGCYEWAPDPLEIASGQTFIQTRECVDLNDCGIDDGKPDEEREEVGAFSS